MDTNRDKKYFEQRANQEMETHLKPLKRSMREKLAYAGRILGMEGHEAGLAGQLTARAEKDDAYWTLRYGLGFDEAAPEDFIEVGTDLETIAGTGVANPATRFHLWVYNARPDVNAIIHAHSPWVSALCAARQPLVVAQMDSTPFYDNCVFLADWPGLPIADQEGKIISEALGKDARSIILAHHGYLTAGRSVEEATYLAVLIERAARMQLRARVYGEITPVPGDQAKEARDFLLQPAFTNGTFEYWCRKVDKHLGPEQAFMGA